MVFTSHRTSPYHRWQLPLGDAFPENPIANFRERFRLQDQERDEPRRLVDQEDAVQIRVAVIFGVVEHEGAVGTVD